MASRRSFTSVLAGSIPVSVTNERKQMKPVDIIGGRKLSEWYSWVCKELTPPLSDKVADHPHVLRFLEIFKCLLIQTAQQNIEIKKQNESINAFLGKFLVETLDDG